MFGKIKQWFGIEGVKLELILPEQIDKTDAAVRGQIRFASMHAQTVSSISVKMVERYQRGRGADKLIDEYVLGEISLQKSIEVPANEVVSIDFSLPFRIVHSDMEAWGDKNFLFKGIAGAAKKLYAAQSEYRVEAEAKVLGTKLSPFDKKQVQVK